MVSFIPHCHNLGCGPSPILIQDKVQLPGRGAEEPAHFMIAACARPFMQVSVCLSVGKTDFGRWLFFETNYVSVSSLLSVGLACESFRKTRKDRTRALFGQTSAEGLLPALSKANIKIIERPHCMVSLHDKLKHLS